MNKLKLTASAAIVSILIGLSGCAAYEKCGLEGCPGDHKITANVQAALSRYPELGEPNTINVNTVNHVVYLTGSVSEGAMRSTAESVARQVAGVARVESAIYVTK